MASASSFQLSSLQIQTPPLKKSNFLGQSVNLNLSTSVHTKSTMKSSSNSVTPIAKFNLYEILGGRGLCNGEEGIEKELKKSISEEQKAVGSAAAASDDDNQENKETGEIPEDGFEKEMMGFTGGFPGGEKGLMKFIEKNPPPPPPKKTESSMVSGFNQSLVKKPKPPELPLLLPGMIAIVKNSNNPYYMYCGIVQRITDGKAAVLFEGGNWDRLISFRLEELERREKGPPMVNLKSVILEKMVEKSSEA